MSSKIFLPICLFWAFAALIVSDVAVARELSETSAKSLDSAKGVEESKYPVGGYGGNPSGGQGGPGSYAGVANPGSGYGGGGAQCTYGCCGGSYNGGGCRCCSYAGEAVDTKPQTQP